MPTFETAVPIFRSFDEAKAREFYIEFLGFTVDWEHRFAPDAPLYMQLSLGACVLHLSEHFGDATPGSAMRILTTDLVAFNQTLLAKNYRHARPGLLEQSWGMREMMISDPFGNRIVFAEPLPGATP